MRQRLWLCSILRHWGSGRASTWGGDFTGGDTSLPTTAALKWEVVWPYLGAERITGTETPGGASNSPFGRREHSFSLRQAALSSLSLSFPKGSNSCHILLLLGLKWRPAELDLPKATENGRAPVLTYFLACPPFVSPCPGYRESTHTPIDASQCPSLCVFKSASLDPQISLLC